ncbi:aminoglycoside phosphotransferase family protein [Microlunatus parietis]|uniref:Streptomycin 6-kinase n=1 Tax=Microlunatus parietis TaxID=682979 RepID=A0A7Y9I765_9ACTN|nr:aminoglycoside phosphotransferase family protein [Microlunatus parietis]NYE71553.1 streptomycin 6-kinase [Microlunatus parietis]
MDLLDDDQHRRLVTYHPGAEEWIERLPGLVAEYARRWRLTIGPTYRPGGDASWAAPAERADGEQVVIKIALPDPDFSAAFAVLRHYDGHGAVRVHEVDPDERASLIERCEPGTTAAEHRPEEALAAAAEVLPRLWRSDPDPAIPVPRLTDLAADRAARLRERADRLGDQLLRDGAALYAELAVVTEDDRLLHGDLNQRNVIRGERGWLAIDPRPCHGDPAHELAAWFVNRIEAEPDPVGQAHRLADTLGLPAGPTGALARCADGPAVLLADGQPGARPTHRLCPGCPDAARRSLIIRGMRGCHRRRRAAATRGRGDPRRTRPDRPVVGGRPAGAGRCDVVRADGGTRSRS